MKNRDDITDDEIDEAMGEAGLEGLRKAAARSKANLERLGIDPADLQEWVRGLTEWPAGDLLDAYRAWAADRTEEVLLLTPGDIMRTYDH
jgi:hypothetical protein